MTHPRTDIRNAVTQRLKDTVQIPVFASRAIPIFDQDLPAILVYNGLEQIKEERWDTDGNGELTREFELDVEAVAFGTEELDKTLDDLAQQIEDALDGWTVPNKQNAILRLRQTDITHDISGNKTYGAVQLQYSITYMTETHNND